MALTRSKERATSGEMPAGALDHLGDVLGSGACSSCELGLRMMSAPSERLSGGSTGSAAAERYGPPMDGVAADVAAVVLVHNGASTLEPVLDAVLAQDLRPGRVLVVDNASTDGSRELVAHYGDRGVELLPLPENVGIGAGHNAGWGAALGGGARHVWALEHDSVPTGSCLRRLRWCAEGTDAAVLIPAQTIDPARQPPADAALVPTTNLHFNGSLIDRRAVDSVGLLREDFFVGHEDREYGARAAAAGLTVLFDPAALVYHRTFGDALGTRATPARRYYGWRNDLWVRIHRNHEPRVRLRAVGAATVTVLRAPRAEGRPWPFAMARVRATVDVLTGRMGRWDYWFLRSDEVIRRR